MQNVNKASSHPVIYGFDLPIAGEASPSINTGNPQPGRPAEQPGPELSGTAFVGRRPAFAFRAVRQPSQPSTQGVTSAQRVTNPFANKPAGTCAITPNGSSAIPRPINGALDSFKGFELHGLDNKKSGAIDTTLLELPGEDCVALTWIEKQGELPKGAADCALWYLSKHTDRPNIEVRSILNEDLQAHLYKNYQMEDVDGDGSRMRGNTREIHALAEKRLTASGWRLKS